MKKPKQTESQTDNDMRNIAKLLNRVKHKTVRNNKLMSGKQKLILKCGLSIPSLVYKAISGIIHSAVLQTENWSGIELDIETVHQNPLGAKHVN